MPIMKIQAVITFNVEVPEGSPEWVKDRAVTRIERGMNDVFDAHPHKPSEGMTFDSVNVFKIE